ncbi:MAG: aspartyl/asparaginyl beta-hydroxylase domain-containing protein [Planctomycetales bacterium]
MNRDIYRIFRLALILGVVAFIYWPIVAVFLVAGIYDVVRQNYNNKLQLARQYFLVNGILTWVFSPLNLIVDVISLPFINKQIYKLEDLPEIHQNEIKRIIENCPKSHLIESVKKAGLETGRSMLLYKWYGFNVANKYKCDLFHERFKTIQTIGVSTFAPNTSTSRHFGWLRAGIRVLINIDEDVEESAYIEVNNQTHSWKENGPLFIFDDTVLHQSFNKTDKNRHCLFIDVTRPSLLSAVLSGLIRLLGYASIKARILTRSSNWKVET